MCGVIVVTFCWTVARLIRQKGASQAGQLQQVDSSQECLPITHDYCWIQAHKVGPLWRNRPYGGVVRLKQEALAVPVVALADARESSSEQWVKRMRDPYKLQR